MQYNPNDLFTLPSYRRSYPPPAPPTGQLSKQPWDKRKQWIVTICAVIIAALLLWDSYETILFLGKKPVLISGGHYQAFPIEPVATRTSILPTPTPIIPFIPLIPPIATPTQVYIPEPVEPAIVPTRVVAPTPTSTPEPMPTPTPEPTETPTPTSIATVTPTLTKTPTSTPIPTPVAIATASP